MKKTMRKPEHWQDFEDLCKKLWGEIWECPSIKKNGRAGQSQHGVDVYGVPKGEIDYCGIQCKGKDDYTNAQLTEDEIDQEIQKALTFKPKLKRFIFTTTANKDEKIETYIREKDVESRTQGNFSIELYSWEDIVDLIEENKNTYEWYVNGQGFVEKNSLLVKINDVEKDLVLTPRYAKKITKRIKRIPVKTPLFDEGQSAIAKLCGENSVVETLRPAKLFWNSEKKENHSLVLLSITFYNDGNETFDDYKLFVGLAGDDCNFVEDNVVKEGLAISSLNFMQKSYCIESHKITYHGEGALVPSDGRRIKTFIRLPRTEANFDIKYRFLSRNFQCESVIKVSSKPVFEETVNLVYVETDQESGENVLIEDIVKTV
ncbi:MAG: hypothetical protein IKB43_01315 [Fibrobacter sp.]|nr:hypothetical protein [Fibrobacter sp.]